MLLSEYNLRHTGKHTDETSAMLYCHIGIINLTMENIFRNALHVTENEQYKTITFTNKVLLDAISARIYRKR